LSPIRQAAAANVVGTDFVAVHMTFGAINEWSTHAGYARLSAIENHPVLSELLGRIMRQETRHLLQFLLGDDTGRRAIGHIDEKIDGLPGLAGLNLVSRAATGYGVG
jgi:hypothetical protein